jgi:uncharacterized lipoprotein NlpE involved in copper resistance
MADDTTTIERAPIEETGGLDTSNALVTKPSELETPPSVKATPAPEAYKPIAPQFGQEALDELRQARERGRNVEGVLTRSLEREIELRRQQREQERPAREELVKDINKEIQFREANPPQPPKPLPPRPRLTYNLGDIIGPPGSNKLGNQFMDMVSVFASLSGGTMQDRVTLMLRAYNGMVDSWAKGKQEQFKENYDAWRDEVTTIHDTEQRNHKYISDVLTNSKDSMALKMTRLQLLGTEMKDEITQEAALRQDVQAIEKIADERLNRSVKMYDVAEKIDKDRQKQEMDQTLADNPGVEFGARQWFQGLQATPGTGVRTSKLVAAANAVAQQMVAAEAQRTGKSEDQIRSEVRARFNAAQSTTRAETTFAGRGATLAANAIQANDALQKMIPQVVAASRLLKQSDWQIVNQLVQAGQRAHSDPTYNAYLQAIWDAESAFARAMNPRGQPRVGERWAAEARGILSQTLGPDGLEAQLYNMWRAAGIEIQSAQQTLREGLQADPFAEPFPSPAPGTEQELVMPPRLRAPPAASTPVGTVVPGRGGKSYRKIKDGPDSDRSTWGDAS